MKLMDNEKKHNKNDTTDSKSKKNFFKEKKVKNKKNRQLSILADGCCANCGSKYRLSAHHIIFKSQGGDDKLSNLITLCFECHRKAHDGYYQKDACDGTFVYISARKFIIKILKVLNYEYYKDTLSILLKKDKKK